MANPKVLICDEPTGSLDVANRNKVLEIFLQLKQKGLTILLVTHDEEVAKLGDVTYRLNDGQMEEVGEINYDTFCLESYKNRKFASITIILAFLAVFLLIPIGLDSTKETKLAVQSSIAVHGRGSYDLLVRPKDSRTTIEQKAGIVEENYIGDSQGGISIEEWQNLKEHPEIEVAAPVASIGYFTGKQLSVELPQLEQSTRFTWEFYTTDGSNSYVLSPPRSLIYFKESQPGNVQYLKDLTLGESASGATMEIMLPTAYHLLSAIDIESEQKLTNIDFSQLENEIDPLELQAIHNTFGNVPIIKVIQREDIQVPLTLKLKAEALEIDIEEYRQKLGLSQQDWLMAADTSAKHQVIAELNRKEAVTVIEREIDLSSFQNHLMALL